MGPNGASGSPAQIGQGSNRLCVAHGLEWANGPTEVQALPTHLEREDMHLVEQEDMFSGSTRRHVSYLTRRHAFLCNKKTCPPVLQEDIFLLHRKTYLLVQLEDMSSRCTRRHVRSSCAPEDMSSCCAGRRFLCAAQEDMYSCAAT